MCALRACAAFARAVYVCVPHEHALRAAVRSSPQQFTTACRSEPENISVAASRTTARSCIYRHLACLGSQVQTENVTGLSALLTFNAGMAASLKDVLKNRDHAQLQYNKAIALLDARGQWRRMLRTREAAALSLCPAQAALLLLLCCF